MKLRKILAFLLMLSLLSVGFALPALATDEPSVPAPSMDWSQYSYDELLALRESLDAYIQELKRQYAIENGNRIITLNEDEADIFLAKKFSFTAEVERVIEDAPEKTTLLWSSSDESVATVSAQGVVTAVGFGDATITCTAADDEYIFATATVHVLLPVSALTLNETTANLLLGSSEPDANQVILTCSVSPENAHVQTVSWSSANESIAVVDENGVVTAVAPGKVSITATSDDKSLAKPKTAVCNITVLQAVDSIELSDKSIALNVRGTKTMKATVLPENASQKKVVWESSDPSVVTVSANGALTACSKGSATITCSATDGSKVSASCQVNVIQMATSVAIEPSGVKTINKGETLQLKAVVSPDNATDPSVSWESSDPSVVTISTSGLAKAVGGGAATILCKTADGSEKSAKISVYVPSISVDKTEYTLSSKEGMSISFNYYGKSENLSYGPDKTQNYSVSMKKDGEKISLNILPIKAGKVTLTLRDKADAKSTTKLTINIEHSACYDSTSYPVGNYTKIMRSPSDYKGDPMSITGYVLQISEGWFSTTLRIATSGRWDNVFYVTCSSSVAKGIIEDDLVTIYGKSTGTETYKTVLGASITIPSIEAERIILGRN